MTSLFVVWTPASLMSALIGGFLVGALLIARYGDPRFSPSRSGLIVFGLGTFAAGVFYAGQAVEVFVSDGPANGWRVVSRFLLFVVFVAFMALGTGIGIARARG